MGTERFKGGLLSALVIAVLMITSMAFVISTTTVTAPSTFSASPGATLSPTSAMGNTSIEFTVTVTNDYAADNIDNVVLIASGFTQPTDLKPTTWNLSEITNGVRFDAIGDNVITPGSSETFVFLWTTPNIAGDYMISVLVSKEEVTYTAYENLGGFMVTIYGKKSHGPIYINGNGDFTPANGVVGGSGTENDPYIIENWDTSGISIRNTTAYVIIRNCYVHDSYYGIYLGDSTNITLDNNILDNNRYNFEVWGSDLSHFIHDIDKTNLVNGKPIYYLIDNSNLVINQDNTIGYLGLISCDNIRVENLMIGSNEQGIFLAYTENSWIENCVFSNNENSIHLWRSNNNTLTGNTCDNSNGIHLDYSNNNTLSGNTIVNTFSQYYGYGIYLVHSDNNILTGNTCDNNYGYGISLYGFNDNNILSGNTCKNNSRGIHLGGHTKNYNNTLINNTCENNDYGIYLRWSDNNLLSNNLIENNDNGIYLDYSNSNFISNNLMENNGDSIWLYNSNNNLIDNNLVKNNLWYGIVLDVYSDNNLTSNNLVENNYCGIWLWRISDNNLLSNNIVKSNREAGIRLYSSNNNLVKNNLVKNNYYGIDFAGSNNNLIYHNNFVNNATQARDYGTNYWDNGYPSGGNYWSDYTGADNYQGENQDILGSDGIGDTPYYFDRYPLMSPWSPIIEAPPTITIISPIDNSTFVSSIVVEANISDNAGLDSAWWAIDGLLVSTSYFHGAENRRLWSSLSGFEHGSVISGAYFVLDDGTIITGQFSVTIINGQQYTIAVFAKDVHGNVSLSKVYITKTAKAAFLSISPSSFILQSGQSITLTATLMIDENENRLPNKTITWSATSGSIDPPSGTTDAFGEVSVTYTAPTVTTQTSVTVTASFAGDNQYPASSDNSYGTIIVSPFLSAMIDITPDTLNLRSRGRWITCLIELPEGYDVADIDMGSIRLNGVVPAEEWPPAIGDHDHDGTPSLMLKFSRPAVQAIVGMGEVELTVTGLVNSTPFEGNDTIRVIKPGKADLEIRFMEIPLEWAMSPPKGKLEIEIEFSEIPFYWALAPS